MPLEWIAKAQLKSEQFLFPNRIHASPHNGNTQRSLISGRLQSVLLTINFDKISDVHTLDDVYKEVGNDAHYCSVYLEEKNRAIWVGEISAEQVSREISDKAVRFIRIGSHYFNRAEIAIIVWFRSSSYANET